MKYPLIDEYKSVPVVEGKYMYGTIREVAEYIAEELTEKGFSIPFSKFRDFDFSLEIDDVTLQNPLVEEKYKACEWYGMKHINTGFDSNDMDLIADYYGGGCAQILQLESGMEKDEIASCLTGTMVLTALNSGYTCESDVILVEVQ